MYIKKLKHDPFCWKCCRDKTNRQCSECERTFHESCMDIESEWMDGDKGWICPVCVKIKSATIVDKQKGLKMLAIIIRRVYEDPAHADFRILSKNGNKTKARTDEIIVKPMNLNILDAKMAKYENYEQFLADVEWMVHNCVILYSESHEKSRLAKVLMDYFIDEIESVKKCAECYANATTHSDTWFTLACNEPHLLIWAKQKGFNYWPAKLMSIDGLLINVRFFGDHTHADIPANNCFLYSKTNPSRMKHTSNLYNTAQKEAEKYIINVREKFGTFNLVDDRNSIDPTKYEKYMAEAFPDLAQYQQAKIEEAASGENIVEAEHIELPPTDYNDPVNEEVVDGSENHIDIEHSSRDDLAFDQVSVASNRSTLEMVVKLTRIDTTLGINLKTPVGHIEKSKSDEFHPDLNKENDSKETHSMENDDDDGSENIQNATDSEVIQQMTAAHEANDSEKVADTKESNHDQKNSAATENIIENHSNSSSESEYPVEKRARLMDNDEVNGRPTMAARKADNGTQKDTNDIETITAPPPPPPPSPHQSSEIDSSNADMVNEVTTKIFTDLTSIMMESMKQGAYNSLQKYITELVNQRQSIERDLKDSLKVQEDLQRIIVDNECKLKRTHDEIHQANDKIVVLTQKLNAKGACDGCGKSSNAVYFCDAICRTTYIKRLTESHTDVGQKANQMSTNFTE